ncbi:hypothetical protein AMK26_03665 [Streptomyces sp. CB03234]|uniref:hypothetical protein n=1 Tax=Streptomyces sp. (strain CB03234) TaxID=1703937 RepID=UPI00093928A9|nr:hypothetical protein [Streptomyces sp. CB03234]OKK08134.1 hypothetical protein AMK26_03665 [Streptomyces sp. CB03234]
MSTVLIVVALVVVFAAVVAAVLYVGPGKAGGRRGRGLKRRFGPEYERTVALHDGDTKAAERELAERVTRHGDLRPRPLSREAREQYVALWAGLQEQFVDAPRQAVAEADRLLARLAEDRGFPAASAYEEQVAALSVHHAHHVDGYRRVHRTARADAGTGTGTGAGTEELRAAMIDARRLFEALVTAQPEDHARHAPRRPAARGHRVHAPWPKGSGA